MLPDYSKDRRKMETLYQRSRRGRERLGYEYVEKKKDFGKIKNCYVCGKSFPITEFKKYFNQKVKRKYVYAICKKCNKTRARQVRLKRKLKAFSLIQKNIICVRCGCTDLRFLEINHKNGGGKKESKTRAISGAPIIQEIVNGTRKTDDLEILCRPCNHIHYLEMKYKQNIPLRVVFKDDENAL